MQKFMVTREVVTNEYDAEGRPVLAREYMLATHETKWTRDPNHEHIAGFPTRAIAESVAFNATDVDLTNKLTIVEFDAE